MASQSKMMNATVAISSGHGWDSQTKGKRDPGMDSALIVDEADVVYKFSRDLAYNIAASGVPVLFRDRGAFFLADDDASKWDAERFYEFHLNAATPSAMGTEVWVDETPTAGEVTMAKRILAAFVKNGFVNRRVKKNDWAVVKDHPGMQSCLVEMFFGTNSRDVALFKQRRSAILLDVLNAILTDLGRSPYKRLPASTPMGKARLWSKKYYRWM